MCKLKYKHGCAPMNELYLPHYRALKYFSLILLMQAIFATPAAAGADPTWEYQFDILGKPAPAPLEVSPVLITRNDQGRSFVWDTITKKPGRQEMVGFALDNGELITVDLRKYGECNVPIVKGRDGNIYLYVDESGGGNVLRYDINEDTLTDLGVPAVNAGYWGAGFLAPDGWFYVGIYPESRLVRCNTLTGAVQDLGPMAVDERQKYAWGGAASDANMVYCPVDMHHMELWAYDVKTDTKKQILPSSILAESGAVSVWTGADGQVYGRSDQVLFKCGPDTVEIVEEISVGERRERLADDQYGCARSMSRDNLWWKTWPPAKRATSPQC